MKKTLRLIITLECNLSCIYCCNKIPEINSKFIKKKLEDIVFEQYENICISGGEPFLKRNIINEVISSTHWRTPIYIYTNGIFLTESDIQAFDGVNIGIHYKSQIKEILGNTNVLQDNIKLCVQDIHRDEYLPNIPDKYVKTWSMNNCFNNIETEDWILLEE